MKIPKATVCICPRYFDDHLSYSNTTDGYDVVEWAGTQDWSNGKVAICGISYLGMACYWTAMQQPSQFAAIVPYEALTDKYGDVCRQGGVWHSGFQRHWFNNLIIPLQYGTNEGLTRDQLAKQRFEFNELATNWIWRSEGVWPVLHRYRDLSKIKVPMLTAGNWMDLEIHLPDNPVSFERASSKWKFLEMHTGNHLAAYYDPAQIERQLKYFDYFLKGKTDNALEESPRVDLLVRRGTENLYRSEQSWPPKDATYTPLYLATNELLSFGQYTASSNDDVISYDGLKDQSFFQTAPMKEDFEILGYPTCRSQSPPRRMTWTSSFTSTSSIPKATGSSSVATTTNLLFPCYAAGSSPHTVRCLTSQLYTGPFWIR